MLLKILGVVDLISGLILILLGTGIIFPKIILIVCGIMLLVKSSFGLLKCFASWIDFVGGLIFLVSNIFEVLGIVVIISGILILQKGASSFL